MSEQILLTLAYDGTAYNGFQVQNGSVSRQIAPLPTIQGTIQLAMKRIYGFAPPVVGCSRTDAGVHARDYKLTYRRAEGMPNIPYERLPLALNTYLPHSISVLRAERVPDSFHVRHDVYEKEYEYLCDNVRIRNPFSENRAYQVITPIDADLLNLCAQDFVGQKDFRAFMASGAEVDTTVRTVRSASVTRCGDTVHFRISADGFLYNMVRIYVGTLLAINEGKLAPDSIPALIAMGDRTRVGMTVPACGLYLNRVTYH